MAFLLPAYWLMELAVGQVVRKLAVNAGRYIIKKIAQEGAKYALTLKRTKDLIRAGQYLKATQTLTENISNQELNGKGGLETILIDKAIETGKDQIVQEVSEEAELTELNLESDLKEGLIVTESNTDEVEPELPPFLENVPILEPIINPTKLSENEDEPALRRLFLGETPTP